MWDRPGAMDRWVEHEYANLNASLVAKRRALAELLADPEPAATTRGGEPWPFDRAALEGLARACAPGEATRLLLPIRLTFPSDLEDSCVISDELAAETLRRAEGFGPAYPYREGRMLLPRSLGIDLVSRYGGAVQAVFL